MLLFSMYLHISWLDNRSENNAQMEEEKMGRRKAETNEMATTTHGIPSSDLHVRITLLEPILGTLPSDPEIFKAYIASKAPEGTSIEEEVASLGVDQVYDNKITVFPRDPDGNVCLFDYLIKGFLKNAASALAKVPDTNASKVKAYKKKIDNAVFVYPRMIKIGKPEEITICERPLRASTPQGDRVAISASEKLPAGIQFDITIKFLIPDDRDLICELLDYGQFNGLGQWHNSGMGRFSWELIE